MHTHKSHPMTTNWEGWSFGASGSANAHCSQLTAGQRGAQWSISGATPTDQEEEDCSQLSWLPTMMLCVPCTTSIIP